MQKLLPALIKAKNNFAPILKDGKNPHYKSKYATLDGILDAVQPALASEGIVIIQTLDTKEGKTILKTLLFHESGESLESNYPLPDNLDSQKFGSAITYARRYSVCAILSVAADEDDDGQTATLSKPKQRSCDKPTNISQNQRVKSVCQVINYPEELAREWLTKTGKSAFNALPQLVVDNFICDICCFWANQIGMDEYHAKNSYAKRVEGAIMDGVEEVQAIHDWMEYVKGSEYEVEAR